MTAPTQCDHEGALFAVLDAVLRDDADPSADEVADLTLAELAFTADWSEP